MTRLLAFSLLLSLSTPAFAYTLMGIKWADRRLPVAWELDVDGVDNITTSADNDEVKRATQAWHGVACSKFRWAPPTVLAANQQNSGGDGKNKVYWVESSWTYGRGTLGVTTPKYYQGGGEIFDADIEFNGQDYNWSAGQGSYCSNCTDTFSIALHEFGHFFGLDHSNSNGAIMYASYPGSPKQALHSDDIAGICALYPKPQAGTGTQGTSCSETVDCQSGLSCLGHSGGSGAICTKTCTGTSDTSCPSGTSCQAATSGFACLGEKPDDGLGSEGESCGQTGGCEDGLLCVGSSEADARCRKACTPGGTNTCSSGTYCAGLPNGAGGACLPGTPPPPARESEACGGSVSCEAELLCVGSGTSARCRRPCQTDAQCLSDQVCTQLPTGGLKACLPKPPAPPASQCQPCGNGVACGTGLSCVRDADGQARCRKPCTSDAVCSIECVERNDIPNGTGACFCEGVDARDPGESCTNDDQCAAGAICIRDGDQPVCRTLCDTGCSSDETCEAVGRSHICRPKPPESEKKPEGCGCASGAELGLLPLLGLLLRRRR